MIKYYSPLRYPGGKSKVSGFLQGLLEKNNLHGGWYVEPYAGGASVALSMLLEDRVSDIVINDLDRSVYAFWHTVVNHADSLCERIMKTAVSVRNWQSNKQIQFNKKQARLIDLGFSTFFLNRTNRSGVMNGGIIGGQSQSGKWKIDARFNKESLIQRIQNISKFRSRIHLFNLDAQHLIHDLRKSLPDKTLFYLDPPYYKKGKALYVTSYNTQDHRAIASDLGALTHFPWVISYDNVPEVRSLYRNFRQHVYSLKYSAYHPRVGSEVMIFSDGLKLPKMKRGVLI